MDDNYSARKKTWRSKRDSVLKLYENKVLENLKIKYGESFEVIGSIGQCLGFPCDKWGVKRVDNGEVFSVLGFQTLDGYQIADSYAAAGLKNGYAENLREAINGLGGEAKAETEVFAICSSDICRLNSRINLIVREAGARVTVMELCKRIADKGLTAAISWYAVKDVMFYGIRDIAALKQYSCESGSAYADNNHTVSFFSDRECGYYDEESEALTDSQLERLCAIAYLDGLIDNSGMEYLGKICRFMKVFGFDGGCEMTPAEWGRVIDDILSDTALSRLRLTKYIDVTETNQGDYADILPGHRALCFLDASNAAYIIFRGTSGDYEWYDNAEGMVLEETTQQRAALKFISEVGESKVSDITVAGHSKGGNKAMFTAITSPSGMIGRCLAVDGQGFSERFIKNNRENIISRRFNIKLMAERRDFVNCLGMRPYNADYIVGGRGEPEPGQPLKYFHCPDSCRDLNNRLGEKVPEGAVSRVINRFITYFLTDPKHSDFKYDIAVDVISIMMTDKKSTADETAEALKSLTILFCEMIAGQKEFRDDIVDLVYSENDMLVATINASGISISSADHDEPGVMPVFIIPVFIKKVKSEFFKNAEFRRDFIASFKHLLKLVRRMSVDKTPGTNVLLGYIRQFIDELTKEFAIKAVEKMTGDFIESIREIWENIKAVVSLGNNTGR